MRLSSVSRLMLVLVVVSGGAALAQRRSLQTFEGEGMTQEQLDAERSGPKFNMKAYGKDVRLKEEPIPWMAIGLAGLVFLAATPFALRAYFSTSREISVANNAFGVSRGGEDEQ